MRRSRLYRATPRAPSGRLGRRVRTWIIAGLSALAPATALGQKIPAVFRDPEDGQFDLSDWLLTRKGFLPIPILVTEPAVGYGGGLAIAFFNQSIAEKSTPDGRFAPPTILVGGGFYTESKSYGGAGGVFLPFRDDQFRYVGALGGTSLNLEFFGFDPSGPLADRPLSYELDAWFLVQRLQARIGKSDVFLGAQYTYLDTKSAFANLPNDIPERDLNTTVGGFATNVGYDTRDNLLDAKRGMDIIAQATWYGPAFGGAESFSKYQVQGLFYGQPTARWGWGLRADARFATGGAPFFMKPWLSMRGIPSGKYLNDVTILGEAELRYSFAARWTLLGFGGAGRVGETLGNLDDPTVGAGGVGFRYMMARKLGLGSGVDFAFGPDGEFAFYIQTGAAWR